MFCEYIIIIFVTIKDTIISSTYKDYKINKNNERFVEKIKKNLKYIYINIRYFWG